MAMWASLRRLGGQRGRFDQRPQLDQGGLGLGVGEPVEVLGGLDQ